MTGVLIEICVDSPQGLAAAIAGGADRIELCSTLALGGLTPAPGLMAQASEAPIPVRAMIRPRDGDFRFDATERDAMLRDIDAVRAAGLNGMVIGGIDADGGLDIDLLEVLVRHADGLDVTLHRVVDLLPDPVAAVDVARRLGIATILTSGGAATAVEGAATIAAMRERAGGAVEILAGSGVRAANVGALLRATGVSAVHASCGTAMKPGGDAAVRLGFVTGKERATDASAVSALRLASEGERV